MMKERRQESSVYGRSIRRILQVTVALTVIFVILLLQLFLPVRSLLPAYNITPRGEGELRLHFLDVGQGDCTVVEFPDGSLLVVDAGDGGRRHSDRVYRYLKELKAGNPIVLATHADADHCGGLADVIRRYNADMVYLPAVGSGSAYQKFLKSVQRAGCKQKVIARYDTIVRGGAYAVCISPASQEDTGGDDGSAVLYLSYAGVNVLLCGDISERRERTLAGEYTLDETLFDSGQYRVRLRETNVLKVSHHGSANASCEPFLELLGAETAIISCGRGNVYGHPAAEALERLGRRVNELYRTDELGDIMITISPDGTYRTEYGYL